MVGEIMKKIYLNEMNKNSLSEEYLSFYKEPEDENPHYLIIGKVIDIK